MLFVSLRFRIRFKIPLFELMSGATVHFAEGMTKTAGIADLRLFERVVPDTDISIEQIDIVCIIFFRQFFQKIFPHLRDIYFVHTLHRLP